MNFDTQYIIIGVIYYVTLERADFKTLSLQGVVIFYIVEYLSE